MQKDLSKVIIISDMDGTFLPHSKEVSPYDLAQINRFRELGGMFTIATGRALQATSRYFDTIKPDLPVILYNGAVAWDTKHNAPLFSHFLPDDANEFTEKILEKFPQAGCEVLCLGNVYVPRLNDVEQQHIDLCKTEPVFCPLGDIPKEKIKILFALDNKFQQDIADFCESMSFGGVDFVKSERRFYEMLPRNISKGSALNEMLRLCKLNGFTVFAAGDYDNDIEMLEASDFGFAVANAQDSVKKKADFVLKSTCEENPITEILNFIYNDWNGGKNNGR